MYIPSWQDRQPVLSQVQQPGQTLFHLVQVPSLSISSQAHACNERGSRIIITATQTRYRNGQQGPLYQY